MNIYIIICLISFLVSAACGFIIIPQILNFCKERHLYDIPNKRKIHKNAIPRLGGVAFLPCMLAATVVALVVWSYAYNGKKISVSPWTYFFALGILIIYITGLTDDLFGVKAKKKLIIQIFSASLLPISWLYINNMYGFCTIHEIPFWIGAPLTVIVLVFIMNAINLIDGIDGLSAGLSFIALSGFLYGFFLEQIWVYCILIAGLMGVLISFLYFNIFGKIEDNRKIFMGDSGSLTLGYILGVLLIKFCMNNPHVMSYRKESMFLSVTLLIVPVFDVFRVIITRLLHKRNLFQPDKNHIHHKLMRMGLKQHQALVGILLLAFFFILFNTLANGVLNVTTIIIADIVLYTLLHILIIDRLIRRRGLSPFQ
ncbi:UNVERIFIED_CONTAM: undecaprenyl/decaprenyl-phosphate alpha-N-acetylglucosaminyl 1-phosphate transferase [Prevotella sp. 15_C9]